MSGDADRPAAHGGRGSWWGRVFRVAAVVAPPVALGVALGFGWVVLPSRRPAPASWPAENLALGTWTPELRPVDAPVLPDDRDAGLRLSGGDSAAPALRMEMASGNMDAVLASYRRQAEGEGWEAREGWGERIQGQGGGRALAFRKDGRLRVVRVGEANEAGARAVVVYESPLLDP